MLNKLQMDHVDFSPDMFLIAQITYIVRLRNRLELYKVILTGEAIHRLTKSEIVKTSALENKSISMGIRNSTVRADYERELLARLDKCPVWGIRTMSPQGIRDQTYVYPVRGT